MLTTYFTVILYVVRIRDKHGTPGSRACCAMKNMRRAIVALDAVFWW